MKNLLLLFLIGATFTLSAQKVQKATPLHLDIGLITPEERAMLNYEKSIRPNYSSSEAVKVGPSWINISEEQAKAAGASVTTANGSIVIYPDSTVKHLGSDGMLSTANISGYGQTINFNNEALSAASDFQFLTNKDTVNVQQIRINYLYARSKTMVTTKSDSLFVSFGVVPRDYKASWVQTVRGAANPTAKNPKGAVWLCPKATGSTAHGFKKVFTGTGVAGFKTDTIALVSGTTNSTINVNKKLINDSLFIYYVTYKPAELAPANDTIFDWNNTTRAKYSSFRLPLHSEDTPGEKTRYFDDYNKTTTSINGQDLPVTYTTNFFQFQETRYGQTVNGRIVNYLETANENGISTEFYVSGNSTLSTDEKLSPKFAIAPNPANNTLKINFKEVGQKSIEIVDRIGRVIHQYAANNANSFSTNDISSLPNGIYFVKITNDLGISATKKLIVSHH